MGGWGTRLKKGLNLVRLKFKEKSALTMFSYRKFFKENVVRKYDTIASVVRVEPEFMIMSTI